MGGDVASPIWLSDPKQTCSIDNVYIALTQCFAVIICGYIAGQTGIISHRETTGLNTFVGKFSLPSLIFISLCKLDLSSVNWAFIIAIFIAKATIFFIVLIITLFVTKPVHYARAGLLAIFCTQTNDFAIGIPVMLAIFGNQHPEFVGYIYLMAPISLTILNPIGFILMEIGKYNAIQDRNMNINNQLQMIMGVIGNIVSNPIVFMTTLGILANYVLDHNPPALLESVLNVFGDAFTGTALMLLGLRMVGRSRSLQGTGFLIMAILLITKLLITPLLMREVVGVVLSLHNVPDQDISTYAMFSFMYGLLPPAPGVFVYATGYALDVDLVAGAMVAGTFLSGPLMFVSAKMISAATVDTKTSEVTLNTYEFDISAINIFALSVVILMFMFSRKFKFPHRITMCLLITRLAASLGSVLQSTNIPYLPLILNVGGDLSSNLWTTALSLSLMLIQAHAESTLHAIRYMLYILPLLIPTCMLIIIVTMYYVPYPKEIYTMVTDGLCCSVLLFSIFATLFFLLLGERWQKRNLRYNALVEDSTSSSSSSNPDLLNGIKQEHRYNAAKVDSVSDMIDNEQNPRSIPEIDTTYCEGEPQFLLHFILIVVSLCSFIVTLAKLFWQIFSSENGLYVELRFLEVTLRRGIGIVAFLLFMTDNKMVIVPLVSWFHRIWYGGNPIELPAFESLPFETRLLCDQFISEHLTKCRAEIESAKWHSCLYGKCFSGAALVDWLVRNHVVRDVEEAGIYSSKLLSGRVIRHIYNTEFFYSRPGVLYTFISEQVP